MAAARPGRLPSIDALRGVASLGVAYFHLHALSGVPVVLTAATVLPALENVIGSYGYVGVWLFFVISGFCIHMRSASQRAAGQRGSPNFVAFWRRRIRRLYPPYLVALALYVAWNVWQGELQPTPFLAVDVAAHLVMLHNLDPHTVYSLNGVFWTLAIEEQLYLAYFLLVKLRDRWGWAATLAVCASARVAWFGLALVLHRGWGVDILVTESAASQWLTWALGAFAVEHAVGVITLPGRFRRLAPAFGLALLAVAGFLARDVRGPASTATSNVTWLVIDPLWGLGFFCVVIWAVAYEGAWRANGPPRLVRALAVVGLFSYSLYLLHEISYSVVSVIRPPFVDQLPGFALEAGYLGVALLASAVYFRLVERPFMSRSGSEVRRIAAHEAALP